MLTDGVTITYDSSQSGGADGVGRACALSADGTVKLAADAEPVVGKLEKVESDGKATVLVYGSASLPGGDAATLTLGSRVVGALRGGNPGYIRSAGSAAGAEMLGARGHIIDAADTDNVYVLF